MTSGFISSCSIKGREGTVFSISHLLYADDTIIFCEAKEDQLLYLNWILLSFEASSGLKINLNKSKLIPIGAVENLDALVVELGCRTEHLPTTYLGLPLGAAHESVAIWDSIEEKMHKRLALWKRNFISKDGRITLIKSTLASLPLYQMSLIRMLLPKDWKSCRDVFSRVVGPPKGRLTWLNGMWYVLKRGRAA